MAWPQGVFQYLSRKRPFCCERIFLYLALSLALGALASDRYHFFWQNYSPFLTQQVLPATGKAQWVEKALHGTVPRNKIPTTRLDTWPWASPMFRNQHQIYGESLIPIGSDYLGIWHYTKMIQEGENPYAVNSFFTYNFKAYNWPMLKDPQVPAQIVGSLSYPPFAALILVPFFSYNYFLSLLGYYLVLIVFILLGAGWILRKASQARIPLFLLLATVLITSYPIAFLMDRGNTEGLLFILIALGIGAYIKKMFYLSSLLIALAACCKFYPAIFLGLFMLDRRWKPLLFGVISIAMVTLASFAVLNGPISQTVHQFFTTIGGFNEFFLFDGRSIQFGHTLCGFVSGTLFSDYADPWTQHKLRTFCSIYPYLIVALTVMAFWRLRKHNLRTRICVLTVMMVYFPFVSGDYTLIHLYFPFGWLLVDACECTEWSLMELLPMGLLGFIFLPKHYLTGLFSMGPGISFALNGLALGALLLLWLLRKPTECQGHLHNYS